MTNIDNENKSLGDNHMSCMNSLKNRDPENCPSSDLLIGYHENKLSGRSKRSVENHIAQCPLCIKALESLSGVGEKELPADYSEIEKKMDYKFYSDLKNVPAIQKQEAPAFTGKYSWNIIDSWHDISDTLFQPRKLIYAGTAACLVITGLYSYAFFSRDRYFSLARIEPEEQRQMRSAVPNSAFIEGLEQFDKMEYDPAIDNFNLYLHTDPEHFASRFYLGLCHLHRAEVKLLGFGYKYNSTEIEEGTRNLKKALQLCGDNKYYKADCLWYLAKASLMKGDIDNARQQLAYIIELNLSLSKRKEEAYEMLNNLNSIQ